MSWLWENGGACMCTAAIIKPFSSLFIKLMDNVPEFEVVFARSFFSFFASIFTSYTKGTRPMFGHRQNLLYLLGRATCGSVAVALFYFTLSQLNLADATALYFTNPAVTAIFARIVLKEPLGGLSIVGILMGLAGVTCVSQPPAIFDPDEKWNEKQALGTLLGLSSAVLISASFIFVRLIGKRETPVTMSVWFHLMSLITSGIPLAFSFPERPVIPSIMDCGKASSSGGGHACRQGLLVLWEQRVTCLPSNPPPSPDWWPGSQIIMGMGMLLKKSKGARHSDAALQQRDSALERLADADLDEAGLAQECLEVIEEDITAVHEALQAGNAPQAFTLLEGIDLLLKEDDGMAWTSVEDDARASMVQLLFAAWLHVVLELQADTSRRPENFKFVLKQAMSTGEELAAMCEGMNLSPLLEFLRGIATAPEEAAQESEGAEEEDEGLAQQREQQKAAEARTKAELCKDFDFFSLYQAYQRSLQRGGAGPREDGGESLQGSIQGDGNEGDSDFEEQMMEATMLRDVLKQRHPNGRLTALDNNKMRCVLMRVAGRMPEDDALRLEVEAEVGGPAGSTAWDQALAAAAAEDAQTNQASTGIGTSTLPSTSSVPLGGMGVGGAAQSKLGLPRLSMPSEVLPGGGGMPSTTTTQGPGTAGTGSFPGFTPVFAGCSSTNGSERHGGFMGGLTPIATAATTPAAAAAAADSPSRAMLRGSADAPAASVSSAQQPSSSRLPGAFGSIISVPTSSADPPTVDQQQQSLQQQPSMPTSSCAPINVQPHMQPDARTFSLASSPMGLQAGAGMGMGMGALMGSVDNLDSIPGSWGAGSAEASGDYGGLSELLAGDDVGLSFGGEEEQPASKMARMR